MVQSPVMLVYFVIRHEVEYVEALPNYPVCIVFAAFKWS